jgi:hypothetical protein
MSPIRQSLREEISCGYIGMMGATLGDTVLLMQLIAAGTGLAFYVASFLGYRWDQGGQFVMAAFVCSFLASIPAAIRDHKFFKRYWGFGLTGIRRRFPLQSFPARRDKWLNSLAWCFMGLLLLHFLWLMMTNSASPEAAPRDTSADLRYVSLMAICAGILGALTWEYPPTEKPQDEDV